MAALIERYWEFEGIPGFDRERIERVLVRLLAEPERGACWVADSRDGLQGYLVAVFVLSLEHDGLMAEIDEIFVNAPYRSLGLGRRLLEEAERRMAAQGLVRLQLQLDADNAAARRFYERQGFSPRDYQLLDKPLAKA